MKKVKETLPQALLRLGLLYQKIKHLDVETKSKIMKNPELIDGSESTKLLLHHANKRDFDDIAV
jgi:hypothetical protein